MILSLADLANSDHLLLPAADEDGRLPCGCEPGKPCSVMHHVELSTTPLHGLP